MQIEDGFKQIKDGFNYVTLKLALELLVSDGVLTPEDLLKLVAEPEDIKIIGALKDLMNEYKFATFKDILRLNRKNLSVFALQLEEAYATR